MVARKANESSSREASGAEVVAAAAFNAVEALL